METVNREECHTAMEKLEEHIDEHFQDVNVRIGDLKDTVNMAVTLLRNK